MPILNEREYRSSKARLELFRRALSSDALFRDIAAGWSTDITEARRVALRAEYDSLRREVEAYESLKSSNLSEDLDDIELGLLPIIGRIARGLSQKQLAEMLGLKEQQIQRYERDRYASANLARYTAVLAALRIELQPQFGKQATIGATAGSPSAEESVFHGDVSSEIRRRGWLEGGSEVSSSEFSKLLGRYVESGMELSSNISFERRYVREDKEFDEAALKAWKARVLLIAKSRQFLCKAKFNSLDIRWIPDLVALSVKKDGPLQAIEFLNEHGIILVIERHLPSTHLDGAALRLKDGTPIVGLTLRYDRIDYFWFTLLHEIGHIVLHFGRGLDDGFFDNILASDDSDREREADAFALSAFIPDEVWAVEPARFAKSIELVKKFANNRKIHPAIVAGRIRRERQDYKIFSDSVGEGQVRKLFSQDRQKG